MNDRLRLRRRVGAIAAGLLAGSLLATPSMPAAATEPQPAPASPYVVIVGTGHARTPVAALAAARDPRASLQREQVLRELAIPVERRFTAALQGFSAKLTDPQVEALRSDPRIRAVIPDLSIRGERDGAGGEAGGEAAPVRKTDLPEQVVPLGVRRVRADLSPVAQIDGVDTRIDVDVAILDSGIAEHPDLVIAGGFDCMSPFPDAWRDRYGHGTHVAGIVGAIDDDAGVVGVAPGARLWAVKILDDNDEGTLSSYLCGIDWVMSQRDPVDPARPLIEVANMSVSSLMAGADDQECGVPSGDAVHMAICASVADGTTYVAAAGNQGYDARFRLPAAYDEVITASALVDFDGLPGGLGTLADVCPWHVPEEDDTYGSFSNYGADVDLIAPGKCILSTFLRKRWAWMTGTSMATPTVAGAAALYISQYPGVRPGQVRQALRHKATHDWFIESDPDGVPDLLLDAASLAPPPDFELEVPGFSDRLAPGSFLRIQVGVARAHGHAAPLTFAISGLPQGVTGSVQVALDGVAWLVLRASPGAGPYLGRIRVSATDGELTREGLLTLSVTGGAFIRFSDPPSGTPVGTPAVPVEVAWTESGSPVPLRRTIRREHALPVVAGSCAGSEWSSGSSIAVHDVDPDGSRKTGWSFSASGLPADGCYRWVVTLTDGADKAAHWASKTVIVDSTAPAAPDIVAGGGGVWQDAANGPVWVRGGGGTLELTAIGRDAAGGVLSADFGALSAGTGWAHSSSTVVGDPAVATLQWAEAAGDTSLDVTSADAVGLVGSARAVALLVDATPPARPVWISPAKGTTTAAYESPELDWGDAADVDSGLASQQLIQQQRGAVVTTGSCSGVTFLDDGPARLRSRLYEPGLLTGHCYRWKLTARDNVGNLGGSKMSGSILFDDIAPTGDFLFPDEGTFRTRSTPTLKLRWTQQDMGGSGGLTQQIERERAAAPPGGGCASLRWNVNGGINRSSSPLKFTDLKPGWCYRWRLVVEDDAENVTTVISGAVRIESGVSF